MDRLIPVIMTEHHIIKMVVEKKIFYCIECSQYQTVDDIWQYQYDKDFPWWGMCNTCNNRLVKDSGDQDGI